MDRAEVAAKIQEIFRDLFDDDDLVISDGTTAADVEDWDSLQHINLITAVEREFAVRFSMQEVVAFKNVGDMIDCVMAKL